MLSDVEAEPQAEKDKSLETLAVKHPAEKPESVNNEAVKP